MTRQDSIEHYLRCPIVLDTARRRLNLHYSGPQSWLCCLLASEGTERESVLARIAILVYATYRTTNAARHSSPLAVEESRHALSQSIYEGARGHSRATRFVDSAFH